MFKVDFKAKLEQLWKRKHSFQGQKLTLTTVSAFFSKRTGTRQGFNKLHL